MDTLLINDVPQILNLGQPKGAFLQVSTQLVLVRGFKDLLNMVEVLFPTLADDQDVIYIHRHECIGEGV